MKLVNGVGIVVAAVAATVIASARAEASAFSFNFCPAAASCATGVTEASLSFDAVVATPDTNDYLLTARFRGDATAVSTLDAWSFAITGVSGSTGNGGYEALPTLGLTFPAGGSPWVVQYDNINNNACNGSGGGQETCVESGGAPPSLTNATLTWTVFVNLADNLPDLSATSTIQLRARFQPNGNLSPGFHQVTVTDGNGGVETTIGPTAVPEPASLTLLGSGLLALASRVRKRLKNRS